MLTIAYILSLIAPSPAMSIDELAEYQARAEAALRLQAGIVEQPQHDDPLPEWAFETPRTPVELDAEMALIGERTNPFACGDGKSNPFEEYAKGNPFAFDDATDPFAGGR